MTKCAPDYLLFFVILTSSLTGCGESNERTCEDTANIIESSRSYVMSLTDVDTYIDSLHIVLSHKSHSEHEVDSEDALSRVYVVEAQLAKEHKTHLIGTRTAGGKITWLTMSGGTSNEFFEPLPWYDTAMQLYMLKRGGSIFLTMIYGKAAGRANLFVSFFRVDVQTSEVTLLDFSRLSVDPPRNAEPPLHWFRSFSVDGAEILQVECVMSHQVLAAREFRVRLTPPFDYFISQNNLNQGSKLQPRATLLLQENVQ